MDKQMIRQEYLLRRRQMSAEDARSKSERITEKLRSSVHWPSIHSAHIYHSQRSLNEVDTPHIIKFVQTDWPQIDLTIGEASPSAPLPTAIYDLILVPVVAFDAQRNRVGFGGGWYDRFLAMQPQAITIGLAYDFQQSAAIPTEPHDVQLNRIVTDFGTI